MKTLLQLSKAVLAGAALIAFAAMAACGGGNKNDNTENNTNMNDECLICGEKLEYLDRDTLMECVLCHRQESSKTRCKNSHYVCSDCHTAGMDSIIALCLEETSIDPIAVLEKMMSQPFCHMHGPEHHVLVGAALLTAYNNALPDTARLDLTELLPEVISRGRQVPGGACGYMGLAELPSARASSCRSSPATRLSPPTHGGFAICSPRGRWSRWPSMAAPAAASATHTSRF